MNGRRWLVIGQHTQGEGEGERGGGGRLIRRKMVGLNYFICFEKIYEQEVCSKKALKSIC